MRKLEMKKIQIFFMSMFILSCTVSCSKEKIPYLSDDAGTDEVIHQTESSGYVDVKNKDEQNVANVGAERTVIENGCGGDIEWSLYDDGTLIVSGEGDLNIDEFNYNDSYIVKVVLEEGISGVGDSVFRMDKNLESVKFPNSLTWIGAYCFEGCEKLAMANLPNTVTSIGSNAFSGCSKLVEVVLPDTLVSLGSNAFENSGVIEIEVPGGLAECGEGVFYNCQSLESIKIDLPMASIPKCMFKGCSNLTVVELADSITIIEEGAFDGCTSIKNIDFPTALIFMGDFACNKCSSLEYIIFPESLQSIGDFCFQSCKSVSSVYIPASLNSIGYDVFSGCDNLTDAYFEATEEFAQNYMRSCIRHYSCKVEDMINKEEPRAYVVVNEADIIADGTCGSGVSWILDNNGCLVISGVGKMKSYNDAGGGVASTPWIEHSNEIRSIIIEYGVKEIGQYSFYGLTNLNEISIPLTVTEIRVKAFYKCDSLRTIYYYGSADDWSNIHIMAFNNVLNTNNIRFIEN